MCRFGWLRSSTGFVALFALMSMPAQAKTISQNSCSDAAFLEEAFSHDLCTRNDRDLRKLNKALSKKPAAGSR
jgi:hypothetical protein